MKKKLNIFIISFNRHKILKQKINFWNKYGLQSIELFIIDGTKKKLNFNKNKISKNINYIHYPTEDYHSRLNLVLKYTNSEYSQIQNDDDYFDPLVLLKSCKCLDKKKNKNYMSVYGKTAIYSTYKKKLYIKELFINDKFKLNNSNQPLKRLKSYFLDQPYSPSLYFSVMRTEILKKIIKIFKLCRREYGNNIQLFAETLITSSMSLAGKSIFLDELFWLRNDSDIKKRIEFKEINKIIKKNSHIYGNLAKHLYKSHQSQNYLNNFFKNIFSCLNISKNEKNFISKIDSIFMSYYKLSIKSADRKKIKISYFKLLQYLKILIPVSIKKILRFKILKINGPNVSSLCSKNFNVKYKFRKKFLINLQHHLVKYEKR